MVCLAVHVPDRAYEETTSGWLRLFRQEVARAAEQQPLSDAWRSPSGQISDQRRRRPPAPRPPRCGRCGRASPRRRGSPARAGGERHRRSRCGRSRGGPAVAAAARRPGAAMVIAVLRRRIQTQLIMLNVLCWRVRWATPPINRKMVARAEQGRDAGRQRHAATILARPARRSSSAAFQRAFDWLRGQSSVSKRGCIERPRAASDRPAPREAPAGRTMGRRPSGGYGRRFQDHRQ
jgi:hypothetical protein